jgi:hypothetical protein
MKKFLRFIRVVLIFIFAYLLLSGLGFLRFLQSNEGPSHLIVGKWEGEREYVDDSGNQMEKIHLEFSKSGILTYSSSLSRELASGIVFQYAFTSPRRLALAGRIRDEWKFDQKQDTLSIEGGIWKNQVVSFRRVPNTGPAILSLLGILIFELLLRFQPDKKETMAQIHNSDTTKPRQWYWWILVLIVPLLSLVLGFITGPLLMNNLSTSPWLLYQGLPWWPLITIEIFIVILIIGIKSIMAYRYSSHQSAFVPNGKTYLGLFLISASFYGLFTGLIRLVFLYILPRILILIS